MNPRCSTLGTVVKAEQGKAGADFQLKDNYLPIICYSMYLRLILLQYTMIMF